MPQPAMIGHRRVWLCSRETFVPKTAGCGVGEARCGLEGHGPLTPEAQHPGWAQTKGQVLL